MSVSAPAYRSDTAAAPAGDPLEPWLAILNPAAGGGRAAARWRALAPRLEARGVRVETLATRAPGHACDAVVDAIAAGRRRVLAVGGDGTVHEVVNALLATGRATDCRLAVVPLGRGNDWARGLGWPRSERALAARLAPGYAATRLVDAGRIDYATGTHQRSCWFANVAGAGFDAVVLDLLPARAGVLGYFAAVVRGLGRYAPPDFSVRAGDWHEAGRFLVVFAALGPACGGGMRLAPAADLADGLFEVLAVRPLSLAGLLRLAPSVYAGRLSASPAIPRARAASLVIDASPPVRVEADGQVLGTTPAVVRVVPTALRVVA